MLQVVASLKRYYKHTKATPLTLLTKQSTRAEILTGVCLCLCLMLFVQSLKLVWFSNIPDIYMHVTNMLIHVVFFSSAFFLSKLGFFELARSLLILTYISYLFTAILLWKINLNIQFYFLLGMFASLYIFHQYETEQMWITLCVFCGLFIYFQTEFVFAVQHKAWQISVINVNGLTLAMSCLLLAVWIRRQMVRSWQKILATERKTSKLLKKVIPEHLSDYLMSAQQQELNNCVSEHAFCSIIFIDFIQFTPFSRQTSDKNLVMFLHRIYTIFDTIAEQHNITKIKTNGDQYIAAAGLDTVQLSAYETSQQCCEFALAIRREFEMKAGVDIGIKIGIASGNAISGMIGQSRPAFDVWGNTMNLASRLESTAADREIQVCQYSMMYSMQHYEFCPGTIKQLKGLGQVTVYKLLGKK